MELYTEVLYNLLHMIGKDADRNGQFEMIEHLRKAFHIEPKEHLEIYNQVGFDNFLVTWQTVDNQTIANKRFIEQTVARKNLKKMTGWQTL